MNDDASATLAAARQQYYHRLQREHMAPLWERLRQLLTSEPQVCSRPHLWRYAALRPLLLEAAELISAEEAERRVLVLENPGLPDSSCITETLYAGLQLIMPGETAPAHRHTPSALRFVLEGSGAYTSVDGERATMEPGDFIITPAWAWHDHGHEGDGPVVWMDVLDLPILRNLGAVFAEHYRESRYPEGAPPRTSLYRYGYNLHPVAGERPFAGSPLFSYPYTRVREAMEHLKGQGEWDACHGLRMQYVDPTTGGAAMPTISTFVQLMPAGFAGAPYRSTDGAVFAVIEGEGRVVLGESPDTTVLDYQPRDVFVIPCWWPHRFEAREETTLFRASDQVVQHKLGVWRERRGD